MPTAGVDDDDFEALLLEHVDALGGDDDRVRFGVAAVERDSGFRRVLERTGSEIFFTQKDMQNLIFPEVESVL